MITLEQDVYGSIELTFDPNLLITPIAHVYNSEEAPLKQHCGVCKARNGILRTHPTYIHYDEESLDLIDDSFQWSYIHPDESAKWL